MDKVQLIGICAFFFLCGLILWSLYGLFFYSEPQPQITCKDGTKEDLNTSKLILCGNINPYYTMAIQQIIVYKFFTPTT